jgi:hypothetical protein
MVIERERYLDDSRASLLSLSLSSRTVQMHSLLSTLSPDDRAAVADAMARALDDIIAILRNASTPAADGI